MFEVFDWAVIDAAVLAASVFGIPIIIFVIGLIYAAAISLIISHPFT